MCGFGRLRDWAGLSGPGGRWGARSIGEEHVSGADQGGCEGVDVGVGCDADAVVAGQAWHWIDPVAGTAKAARVLRPGGMLALFRNVFGFPPDVAN